MKFLILLLFPIILISAEPTPHPEFSDEADPLMNFINSFFLDENGSSFEKYKEEIKNHSESIVDKILSIFEDGADFANDMHSQIDGHFAAGKWDEAIVAEFGNGTSITFFLKNNTEKVKQKIHDFLDDKLSS